MAIPRSEFQPGFSAGLFFFIKSQSQHARHSTTFKLCRRRGWSTQHGRSGRAGARRLQGCGPPQQIVDQRPGRRLQLGQSSVDIAALVVSP